MKYLLFILSDTVFRFLLPCLAWATLHFWFTVLFIQLEIQNSLTHKSKSLKTPANLIT